MEIKKKKDNPNDMIERDIGPNKDESILQEDTSKKARNRYKSKVLKNHPISNVIGNMNEYVVTRRQSRLNEMSFICYTSQLELRNVDKALGDGSWTTAL